jgi:hypothetical protein
MSTRFIAVAVACMLSLSASTLFAQCCGSAVVAYPRAVASYAAYYAPQPYVNYYAPPVTPYVSYYAPAVPYVSYYAPATPYVSYYAPYAVAVRPYYGVVGSSIYGTARVYVPGQPVRNVARAVLP